jgi:hypothetical protein
LDEDDVVGSNRLRGVNLAVGRRVIIPEDFLVGRDERDAILMREQNISVGEQRGVADFAPAGGVVVSPDDFSAAHNIHVARPALARVKKIMLRQPVARQNRRGGGLGSGLVGAGNLGASHKAHQYKTGGQGGCEYLFGFVFIHKALENDMKPGISLKQIPPQETISACVLSDCRKDCAPNYASSRRDNVVFSQIVALD